MDAQHSSCNCQGGGVTASRQVHVMIMMVGGWLKYYFQCCTISCVVDGHLSFDISISVCAVVSVEAALTMPDLNLKTKCDTPAIKHKGVRANIPFRIR
jgi:hypothetical protein